MIRLGGLKRDWLAALLAVAASGCGLQASVDDAAAKVDANVDVDALTRIEVCGGMTIGELMHANELTDECREALYSYLPEDADNLDGRVVVAGEGSSGGQRVVALVGANAEGAPLNTALVADLNVSVGGSVVAQADLTVTAGADWSGMLASMGNVLDYSGSMRDSDVNLAVELFGDLFAVNPSLIEHEVRIFSDDAERKCEFSTDRTVLLEAVALDPDFARGSTRLFDTMAESVEALGEREGLVKLLVVSTDGGENASTLYQDQEHVFALAREKGVHIVVMGSLLADINFMRDAATETDGFFFYARHLSDLRTQVQRFVTAVEEMVVVELPSGATGPVAATWQ